jgi:hypothetical protein
LLLAPCSRLFFKRNPDESQSTSSYAAAMFVYNFLSCTIINLSQKLFFVDYIEKQIFCVHLYMKNASFGENIMVKIVVLFIKKI